MTQLSEPTPARELPRRILWVVNHRTLIPAEIPILRSLGWEVFVPKLVPEHDPGYRSAAVSYEHDAALGLLPATLAVLNSHRFYERPWTPTVTAIVNDHFDVVISMFTYYCTPLSEAARKFAGLIVARAFGREYSRTYAHLAADASHPRLLDELAATGDRFVFAQAYDNLAEIEPPPLRTRARTITVPLPPFVLEHEGTWTGGGRKAVFLCPSVSAGYYRDIYAGIKRNFADVPRVIFGRQPVPVDDPDVLPYLTDEELVELYARAPVFVYPHDEPRHLHYSPLEAMVVGAPVLYLRGAMIDVLAGRNGSPAACADHAEMREKARRLIAGDERLASEVRSAQVGVLDRFSSEVARSQWSSVLENAPAVAGRNAT